MKEEIQEIRTKLQDMIARAERDYGSDHEFTSAFRSADDNLSDAEDTFDKIEEELEIEEELDAEETDLEEESNEE